MRARKRFGQHFLTDSVVLEQIAAAVAVRDADAVFEIGPGHGALTEHIYRPGLRYTAVEIDRDLIPMLKVRFPEIQLVNADILRVDFAELLADSRWRIIGNLPYNISSPLVLRAAEAARAGQVVDMHFMLQKEMAARLCATSGSKAWGRLSVIIQLMCDVEYLFDVAPESFTPPPKVWSGVVRLRPRTDAIDGDAQARLNRVLTAAFSGRRKRLSNSLKHFDVDWDALDLDPGVRADNVDAGQFLAIAESAVPRATDE
jgi:16S rRNA (adenine1518-N6/adenine1519-N6)-dimethyltransferase